MSNRSTLIPIYTTRGDLGGFLRYPYIFNTQGEWIGWATADREVYSVSGFYVGWLSSEPRILRKRSAGYNHTRRAPPGPPDHFIPPANVRLAPMMSELPMGTFDVLDEDPELLPVAGFGSQFEDMD
jgi:hypothetical protein